MRVTRSPCVSLQPTSHGYLTRTTAARLPQNKHALCRLLPTTACPSPPAEEAVERAGYVVELQCAEGEMKAM